MQFVLKTTQRVAVMVMVAALLAVVAVGAAQGEGQLRFVHAFVDAPDVDIYANGSLTAEGVPYGAASDFVPVNVGDVNIQVTQAGTNDTLFQQTVTTGTDPITLVVADESGFVPFVDNVDPLAVGETRITAIHAIPDGPVVDVVLTDGRPVISELGYAVPFGTLDLPVIKLPLNVVPTGTDLTNALFPEPIVFAPVTNTTYTVVVYGEVTAPEIMVLAAPVLPNPGDGFVQITHAVSGAPAVDVYAGETLIVAGLEPDASTPLFPVPAAEYMVDVFATDTSDEIISATLVVERGADTRVTVEEGADGIEVVVDAAETDGAVAEMAEAVEDASLDAEVEVADADTVTDAEVVPEEAEAPQDDASEIVVVTLTPTPAEVVAAQPTAAPVTADATGPTGRVIIDPGANLQLRQFPDTDALSLGLAPSGATLVINGREGAPVQVEGLFSEEVQREIDTFVDPAEDLDENQDIDLDTTWLNVTYNTPDGGQITAWVLAQFLAVSEPDGSSTRLADLPTIPSNQFGETAGTEATPPPIDEDVVVAVVFNLDPGVNLKIRRTSSQQGETLALIQAGTVLELLGFGISGAELPSVGAAEDADWAYIEYTTDEGGQITGWVSTLYLQYQWRGGSIEFQEMEDRDLLLFEDETTRGEVGGGVAPLARATVDPFRNQAVATVTIDPGANLQLRRNPESNSESLGLIPSGTQLIVTARNAGGDWLFVEFEGVTGWISIDFVNLTFNDEPLDIDELVIDDEV